MPAIRSPYYEITTFPARDLLTVRFETKFWSFDVVDRFIGDLVTAAATLPDPARLRSLVDLRNAIIQSAEVIARLQDVLANGTSGPIALVASTPLARMQTKRLRVREGIELFETMEAGEAWLASVGDPGGPCDPGAP